MPRPESNRFGAVGRWAVRAAAWITRTVVPASARHAFAGAITNRLTADWILAPIRSADEEIRGDLSKLRGRSRELVRNNAYAARHVSLVEDNVVGPHGIALQCRVKRQDGRLDSDLNELIEAAWLDWGRPENCTVDGRLSWRDVQRLCARTRTSDGEAFVRVVPDSTSRYGVRLQVVDPDQVPHDLQRRRGENGNEIRMGVEIDDWGKPVAYYVYSEHPGATILHRERTMERVPARWMVHFYDQHRPGQTRGVPDFAPVLLDLRMLHGLQEAELTASRIAAAKMGFFTVGPEAATDLTGAAPTSRMTMEAEPGLIDTLPLGWDFKGWDPQHPNSAFAEFQGAILRSVAVGLGTSYAALTGDLRSVNYSSIRQGALSERDHYRALQMRMVEHIHDPVFHAWLELASLAGGVGLPSADARRYTAHVWRPRGWDWVDPLKEMKAYEAAVALRVDSRSRIAAERGRDFEEVLQELREEDELAAWYGVALTDPTKGENDGSEDADASDDDGQPSGESGQPGRSAIPAVHPLRRPA